MIKRFCDVCGDEITTANAIHDGRLKAEVRKRGGSVLLRVEVHTAKGNTWNDGDFCKYCVLDALYRCDDRAMCAD